MMKSRMLKPVAPVVVLAMLVTAWPARAYVEAPYTLGRLVTESTNVLLMRVEKVDKEKNLVIYRKVKDLKGVHPTDVIKHNIGHAGFNPREWQYCMEGAQVGNLAVMFHNGGGGGNFFPRIWEPTHRGGLVGVRH